MSIVAAYAPTLREHLSGRLAGVGVLVAEGDMAMDEVADRLDPRPAERRVAEEVPRRLGEEVRLAISAAEKKNQRFLGQVLDRVLAGRSGNFVGLAGVANDAGAGDANASP